MYAVENGLVIVDYTGVLQKKNIFELVSTLSSYKKLMEKDGVKIITISLKKTSSENIEMFKFLIEQLSLLEKKLSIPLSLCEYSAAQYFLLANILKKYNFMIFKTKEIAKFFANVDNVKKQQNVLLFEKDLINQKNIYKFLSSKNCLVKTANTTQDFKDFLENQNYDIAITQTIVPQNANKQNALPLEKKLVENILYFVDTAVSTLHSFTGKDAHKVSHSIQKFDRDLFDVVVAVMSFKGDIHGNFILIFPKTLAIKTLEAMLEDTIGENDYDSISDGVGEFCNIITGGAKTQLSKKGISVLFDLPKMYLSHNSLEGAVGEDNGIWINMKLDDSPFYMFITT